MDILIKGIKMPKGGTLTLVIYPNGDVYLGGVLEDVKVGKAFELPPHGELKDATEMLKDFKNWFCKDCNNYNKIRCRSCSTREIIDYIEGLHTIAEATE